MKISKIESVIEEAKEGKMRAMAEQPKVKNKSYYFIEYSRLYFKHFEFPHLCKRCRMNTEVFLIGRIDPTISRIAINIITGVGVSNRQSMGRSGELGDHPAGL